MLRSRQLDQPADSLAGNSISLPKPSSVSGASRIFTKATHLIILGSILNVMGFNIRLGGGIGPLDVTELVGGIVLAIAIFQIAKIKVNREFRDVMLILVAALVFTSVLLVSGAIRTARAPVDSAENATEFVAPARPDAFAEAVGAFSWTLGSVVFCMAMSWLCRVYGLRSTESKWRGVAFLFGAYLFLTTVLGMVLAVIFGLEPGTEIIHLESPELGCLLLICNLVIIVSLLLLLDDTRRGLARLSSNAFESPLDSRDPAVSDPNR